MVSGDVSLSKLPGPLQTKIIVENIESVRNLVEQKLNSSISLVFTAINLSPGNAWNILRKTLKTYSYKPKTVKWLSDQLKLNRVQFCNLGLQQN